MKTLTKFPTLLTLGLVAIIAVSCGSDRSTPAASSGPTPTPTDTPGVVSVPPLPTVDIFVGDVGYEGELFGYCWPEENMPEHAVMVCADPPFGVYPGPDVPVPAGMKPRVFVDSHAAPDVFTGMLFADPAGGAVELLNLRFESARELDIDFTDANRFYLRVHGEWEEGAVDYGFWLVQVPEGDAFTAECMWTEAEPLPIEFIVLSEDTPTEFDGINSATCTFSKPVTTINVTLTGNFGSVHNQSFTFDPPRSIVPFPLDRWNETASTAELLAPGVYERRMAAISEIGEEWVITDHIDAALDEVTVVEGTRPTPVVGPEWDLEDVAIDGSTVRVTIRVFSTTDLAVVIDRKEPDATELELPLIHYVFENVETGTHELSITDLLGNIHGQAVTIP